MISTETFKNRIQAPPVRSPKGSYQQYLYDFIMSENMTLKLNCSNLKEAEACYRAMLYGNKRKNYNITVWRRNTTVYVIKG